LSLDQEPLPQTLCRLGRTPNAWEPPPWEAADPATGTFGNRWDDPDGVYRVVYTSTTRLGCFLECLARLRPDPAVVAGLAEIIDDGEFGEGLEPGILPRTWVESRAIGTAQLQGRPLARLATAVSLAVLNRELASLIIEFGLKEIDGATLRMSAPRRLTRMRTSAVPWSSWRSTAAPSGHNASARLLAFGPRSIGTRDGRRRPKGCIPNEHVVLGIDGLRARVGQPSAVSFPARQHNLGQK